MMKNAIKLLVLAGALLSVGAMAAANQTWKFGFPTYAYIYTNSTEIYFDFTTDSQPSGTDASVLGTFNTANLSNLESCIDGLVAGISGSVTADGAAGSDLGTCYFAPSGITHSGYSVDWNNVDATGTDGSLLVVTNASSYHVDVSVAAPPSGVTFLLADAMASNIADASSFGVAFNSSTTTANNFADQDSDYATQYRGTYVIPLSFAVGITPDVAAQNLANYDMTYTISAP